ncbi:putative RNA polymerase sigma factor [Rhodococcus sp. AW25M09]|uniref:hypothetical protein n=1 Tax=Rhodococcus sp. AW25M09 TaxID=1268303 RepID=UPI0002AC69B5|nr:hypothetical protein [Rhodococcus sp. AW25M09]CCQ17029.1 putative RNA polymerase sigma factor [Rhodococcus sp. AW25M09]
MSTPEAGIESPRRNWRQWRIPTKIAGRVRTSTVAFGICFVLTGLLYGQVNAEVDRQNEEAVQGPVAVDPSEGAPTDSPPSSSVSATTAPTPTATTEAGQSGGPDETGQQSVTTAPLTTTTAPFGLPLPPGIQSLIPSPPAPTSAR